MNNYVITPAICSQQVRQAKLQLNDVSQVKYVFDFLLRLDRGQLKVETIILEFYEWHVSALHLRILVVVLYRKVEKAFCLIWDNNPFQDCQLGIVVHVHVLLK